MTGSAADRMTPHPPADRLAAYAVGRLDPLATAEVESHLSGCEGCAGAVEQAQAADPLLEAVRTLSPHEVRPAADRAAPPPELAGHPRYRLDQLLGRGGMGEVWSAVHLLMNRRVAVKLVHPDLARSPAAVARFRREVEAAARLDHPHVVRTYDADEVAGRLVLVMELVEGPDLARVVADRGPLPVAEAVGYAHQAALGLGHAHEAGLVHRDVKPQNLLIAPGGVVKVADFGLASVLDVEDVADGAGAGGSTAPGGSLTRAGQGCGTPDYVSPEQVRDAKAADARADLYSLGCTLYHLLAGRPPFGGGSGFSKIAAHLERTPPPITALRPDLPPALVAALDRLLAKDPAARFGSAREAADALADALATPNPPAVRRWTRRRVLGAGVSGAGVLAAGGWYFFGRRRVPQAREVARLEGHSGGVHSVALSHDGGRVVSAAEDNTARVWSLAAGREVARLEGHTDWVGWADFLPDGRRVATASYDGTVRLWDADTGAEARRCEGAGGVVLVLAVSPDGFQVLSGGEAVALWDVRTGQLVRRLGGLTRGAQCVRFLPGGRGLGSGDGRSAAVWDLATGQVLAVLGGHSHAVDDVNVSADGALALAACRDGTARLWDLTAGQPVERFVFPHRAYRVLSGPAGFQVVCTDELGGAGLWDLHPRREMWRLAGHEGAIWGVVVTADGRTAVTGGVDGTVRVWDLPG